MQLTILQSSQSQLWYSLFASVLIRSFTDCRTVPWNNSLIAYMQPYGTLFKGFSNNRLQINSYTPAFSSSKEIFSACSFTAHSFWSLFLVSFWQLRKPYVWKVIWEVDFPPEGEAKKFISHSCFVTVKSPKALDELKLLSNCKGHMWDWRHKTVTTLKHEWEGRVCAYTCIRARDTMHFTKTPSKSSRLFSV